MYAENEALKKLVNSDASLDEASERIDRESEALRVAAEADLSVALAMTKELHEELKIRDEEHAQVQSKTQIGAGKCTVVCGGSCTRRNCERSAAGKA